MLSPVVTVAYLVFAPPLPTAPLQTIKRKRRRMCLHFSRDSITSGLPTEAVLGGLGRGIKEHNYGLYGHLNCDLLSMTRRWGKRKALGHSFKQTIEFIAHTDGCLCSMMRQRNRSAQESEWELLYKNKTSTRKFRTKKTLSVPTLFICLSLLSWLLF